MQPSKKNEFIFQVIVHILLFLTVSVSIRDPQIQLGEFFLFINYAIAAYLINYFVLPTFYAKRNLVILILSTLFILISAICIEELIIEQIFFQDDRGKDSYILITVLQAFPKIMMLVGFKLGWDALKMKSEMEELKDLARQSELQFLQTQINPHFLFNNLNNLYSYALEGSAKTPEIILELSGLLRYMLYECKSDFVPLEKEIEQLENFINLNELQIEERGKVDFTQKGIPNRFEIAPLILIVFVENAFKHSVSSLANDIKISISTSVDESGLFTFTCINNYESKSNTDKLAHGIGLENVSKRLDIIYPDRYKLHCEEKDDLYVINLTIELHEK